MFEASTGSWGDSHAVVEGRRKSEGSQVVERFGPASRWDQVANALHGNSYEDETAPEDTDDSLSDLERLLDKVEPLFFQK